MVELYLCSPYAFMDLTLLSQYKIFIMRTQYINVESCFVDVSEEHIASIFRVQDIQGDSDRPSAFD
jgi:hypothetical protein